MASSPDQLVFKIRATAKKFQPGSRELNEAFTRIGLKISADAKLNVRRLGKIDTGRLINSLRYEFFRKDQVQGVSIGSFGVPYAAIHEFGGPFTDQMRKAMFASLARRGRLGAKKPGTPTIVGNQFLAKPYLRPALKSNIKFVTDTLATALGIK